MAIGNYRGCLAIAGGITVHLTIGTLYTFGNMSPYVTSYIRERSEPSDLRYQDTNIIYALMICGQATMMPLSSVFFAKKLGARLTTLLGGWLASLGMLLSYLAIQSSFYALVITYGLMFGAGVGIAYIPPLICAMKWLPKKKGLASGLIVAGFGGGSFIFNLVQTVYINPENVSLNVSVPEHPDEKYFDEAEVLDNVPSSFLVLGVTYAVMQLIGVMLLSEPSEHNKQEIQLSGSDSETDRLLKNEDRQRQGESYYSEKEKLLSSRDDDDENITELQVDPRGSGIKLRPVEMVKTRAFWIVWFTFLLNFQGNAVVSSLYKVYGQTFISDDTFLAVVGSISAIGNAAGRLFWGNLADTFSYKKLMLSVCCIFAILLLTLMATPYGGKAMFLIWIVLTFFTFSGSFALFPTVIARSFGIEHFAINYGLAFTCNIIGGPVGALLPLVLQDVLGWNGLFAFIAGLSAISFVLTLMFNIKRPTGKDI